MKDYGSINSSEFNDVIKGYMFLAMEWAEIDEETIWKAQRKLHRVFDEFSAQEAESYYLRKIGD